MAVSKRAVHVVGVGMIPFTKPGASESYHLMGARAAQLALDDAGVPYDAVQQAYVGYVYGDSTAGQAASRCAKACVASSWGQRPCHTPLPTIGAA